MHLLAGLSRRQPQSQPPKSSPSDTNTNSTTSTPTSSISLPLHGTSSAQPSATSEPSSASGGSKTTIIVVAIVVITIIGALVLGFYILRRVRHNHKNPKYVPTSFLKKRWEKWEPSKHRYRLPDTNDPLESVSSRGTGLQAAGRSSGPPSSFDTAARNAVDNAMGTGEAAGVDRNTSVRSVMTLPAYNQHARDTEQVLAREGERGGIDMVIEFPEGVDEEESRREEEMEALYQVRLARRRENEEREERRRQRREARERGDYVALRAIQARARATSAASAGRTVEELRAEHERIKKERLRAVSSVQYADLGVARHDGTRIRANSMESEREGLLGDAASIAQSSQYHRRERSASSVLSIDTVNSDLPSPGLTRSRANSRGESSLRRVSTSHTQSEDRSGSIDGRAGSSPEIIGHDDIPPHSPPGYENISLETPRDEHRTLEPPPDYSSPVTGRGEGRDLLQGAAEASERRISASHGGQLVANRRTSSSSSISPARSAATSVSRQSSRGVGGTPQLPSLRLSHLPSIHVDSPSSPSPISRRIDEDAEPGNHQPDSNE